MKRLFDLAASAFGLFVLSPLLFIVAFIVKRDGGPALYRGKRVGKNGELFDMLKFRTMVINAEKLGPSSTAGDDPRITKIGHMLRKYKMDELPQLINVFKGEMSIVGPRPQVKWEVDNYTEEEREVLKVRPGITDPASLKFRNEGEILRGSKDPDADYRRLIHPEKMRLSIDYVRNRSFIGDIRIVLKTIAAIFE